MKGLYHPVCVGFTIGSERPFIQPPTVPRELRCNRMPNTLLQNGCPKLATSLSMFICCRTLEKVLLNLCSEDTSASRFPWSIPKATAAPHQSSISPSGASARWRYPRLSKFSMREFCLSVLAMRPVAGPLHQTSFKQKHMTLDDKRVKQMLLCSWKPSFLAYHPSNSGANSQCSCNDCMYRTTHSLRQISAHCQCANEVIASKGSL